LQKSPSEKIENWLENWRSPKLILNDLFIRSCKAYIFVRKVFTISNYFSVKLRQIKILVTKAKVFGLVPENGWNQPFHLSMDCSVQAFLEIEKTRIRVSDDVIWRWHSCHTEIWSSPEKDEKKGKAYSGWRMGPMTTFVTLCKIRKNWYYSARETRGKKGNSGEKLLVIKLEF
jgi:hypothetical protein